MPPASNSVRRARPLLGTFVEIAAAGAVPADTHAAIEAAFAAVAQVHALMSFHEATSDVARLNNEAATRPVGVHPWTFTVLETAVELHRRSDGLFDIAVATTLQDLRSQNLRLLPTGLPRPQVERSCAGSTSRDSASAVCPTTAAIELLGGQRVRFRRPDLQIDLGGIAKGFAVDRAVDVLRQHGMQAGLVNAGGDLLAFGPNAETVHIRDPHDPSRLLLCLKVANQALASSALRFDPLRSAAATETAIIDPSTRRPPETISGATVRARSCMIADALTKVVMIAGPSAAPLLDHYAASALVVSATGRIEMTEDLQDVVCLAA